MKTKYSLSCLLVAALFAACDDDHEAPVNPDWDYPVVITAQAYSYDAQAGGTTWVGTDNALGVTFLQEGEAGVDQVVAPYANLQYLANGISDQDYFVPADINAIPYFPASGEKRHVAAYFPYSVKVIDQQLPINLHADGKDYASKLLFARVDNMDKDHRKCMLKMRPALSQITFRFKVGEPFTMEQLEAMKVTLKGFHLSGLFKTTDGMVSFRAEDTADGEIALAVPEKKKAVVRAAEEKYVLQGIALPSTATATYEVEVICNGQTYTQKFIVENIDELKGGYVYTFEPTFEGDKMMLNCQSAPIINWKPGDGEISGDGEEINND